MLEHKQLVPLDIVFHYSSFFLRTRDAHLYHTNWHTQLLAYQRKKKVKRRKRKADSSDSSSRSEPLSSSLGALDADSSSATLPHSGNVSPIPFDDTGHSILTTITDGRTPAVTSTTQLLSVSHFVMLSFTMFCDGSNQFIHTSNDVLE